MDTNESNGRDEEGTTVKKQEATEETGVVKAETKSNIEDSSATYEAVLAFLRKKGLSNTEDLFKKEISSTTGDKHINVSNNQITDSAQSTVSGVQASEIVKTDNVSGAEVSNLLSSYKSEGDPSIYAEAYKDLQRFVESSLDLYRHELALILVSASGFMAVS